MGDLWCESGRKHCISCYNNFFPKKHSRVVILGKIFFKKTDGVLEKMMIL